ncbi:ArsO family NAD(P)H-dependent flavin-containing monooxygenase [Arthrobacter sp. VKM Ac-2550]|uniref:ArsO family NAD(P)H-dependent flavin-containing monooxygenase n=1 Tax=Crystallibacter permensis TaxID=1938888 RepID=UPI002226C70C|nr:ArsO family NAD(P)H-dependent flavin-containing monooxygenase [Arthrobacter sp. VKM Ac-2550]MCW2131101.1 putative flavoprotein involved in K+ transport [Arthrobacter sp. VKM Ac-2550]
MQETEPTGASRDVDVLVLGGGQAGLAAGFYLNRLRRDAAAGRTGTAPTFAILDANAQPGSAWQHYWDSLELFSPAAYSSLPGYQMPAWHGEGNPSARHVVEYLRTYETRYGLPVHRPVTVTAVRQEPDSGFATITDQGRWTSRAVISATGNWNAPYVPQLPGSEQFTGRQLHTADYRDRDSYAGLRVIVVGGANSGAQIAADLVPVAAVTWVTRKPPHYLPDDIDGRALFQIATHHARAVANGEPSPGGVASFGDIVAVPAVRAARDAGQLNARPMFSRLTSAGVQWDDGQEVAADVIIWCTGFRPDLQHLQPLDLTTLNGIPETDEHLATHSTDHPGLFFLGYGDWCGPASATLIGVGAMARDSVKAVAQYLDNAPQVLAAVNLNHRPSIR